MFDLDMYYCYKVAFGMDFYEDEYVKKLCGSQDLLSLMDLAMDGVSVQYINHFLPVSNNKYNLMQESI